MRIKIGTKIILGFAGVLMLMIIMGVVVLYNVNDRSRQFNLILDKDSVMITKANEINRVVVDMQTGIRGYVITHQKKFLEPYNNSQQVIADLFQEEENLASDNPAQVKALGDIEAMVKSWQTLYAEPEIAMVEQVIAGTATQAELEAFIALGVSTTAMDQIRDKSEQFIATAQQIMDERRAKADSAATTTVNTTIILMAVSALCGSIIAFFISRAITRPVSKLADASQAIAKGDLTPDIAIKSRDEIGKLAGSFKQMLGGLKEIVHRVLTTSADVSTSSQQLSEAAQETNTSVQQVSAAIQQVAKGAQTLAQRASETTKVMEDLNASITQGARSAQQAAVISAQATQSAKTGADRVKEAIATIEKIGSATELTSGVARKLVERSEQMADIVTVITNIADQVNLLALNAAIEAARAGEAGKGFAVVAEEVRKLAENSGRSASEIRSLIKATIGEIEAAVKNMESCKHEVSSGKGIIVAAGAALEEILQANQIVATMLQQISAASQQMSSGAQQVVKAVEDAATIAEETATSTQQASASTQDTVAIMQQMSSSAQALAQMGTELKSLVAEFKTGEEDKFTAPATTAPALRQPPTIKERVAEAKKKMEKAKKAAGPAVEEIEVKKVKVS